MDRVYYLIVNREHDIIQDRLQRRDDQIVRMDMGGKRNSITGRKNESADDSGRNRIEEEAVLLRGLVACCDAACFSSTLRKSELFYSTSTFSKSLYVVNKMQFPIPLRKWTTTLAEKESKTQV